MSDKKALGDYGEAAAQVYLENMGYVLLEKNYRCKFGEIDIIAVDGDSVVFIEVKTRRTEKFGRPGYSVNFAKQRKIIKSALWFITQKRLTDYMSRFDVVEIVIDDNRIIRKIELTKNAFEYSGNLGY